MLSLLSLSPGCAVLLVLWPVFLMTLSAAVSHLQTSAAPVSTLDNAARIVTNTSHKWLQRFPGLISLLLISIHVLLVSQGIKSEGSENWK